MPEDFYLGAVAMTTTSFSTGSEDSGCFNTAKIIQIIIRVLPNHRLKTISELETYHYRWNCIYHLTLAPDISSGHERAILKISCDSFGPEKIQNEVASLCLLEQYCSDFPAPRVLGWSDGSVANGHIHVLKRSSASIGVETFLHPRSDECNGEFGWILLTERKGRTLHHEDLAGEHGECIVKQLAQLTAQIRQKLPTPTHFGNLKPIVSRDAPSTPEYYSSFLPEPFRIKINGLLNHTEFLNATISFAEEYYQLKIRDRLAKLKLHASDIAQYNLGNHSSLVEKFIAKSLPQLLFFHRPGPPTFTRRDFSPQNVLISGSPPSVTGVVDLEFAGFFPAEEELMDMYVNEEIWTCYKYDVYLKELERLGVNTPLRSLGAKSWRDRVEEPSWEMSLHLMYVTEHMFPWSPRDGIFQEFGAWELNWLSAGIVESSIQALNESLMELTGHGSAKTSSRT